MRFVTDQLPMFPVYEAPGASEPFARLRDVPGADHPRNGSHRLVRQVPTDKARYDEYSRRGAEIKRGQLRRPTLLHGVYARPAPASERVEHTYGLMPAGRQNGKHLGLGAFAERALEVFTKHIEDHWVPGGKHAMLYSSGFDTRLVSGLIKHLWRKHGDDWLGELRFITFEPEIAAARVVFDHMGWPEACWHPAEPTPEQKETQAQGEGLVDYYRESWDFDFIGTHMSDNERIWGGPLKAQLSLGAWLDEDVQLISGLWSDETINWAYHRYGDVAWFIGCFLMDQPSIFPGSGITNMVLPYVSAGWVELLTEYKLPIVRASDELKLELLRQLDSSLVALPNYRMSVKAMRDRNAAKHGFPYIDTQVLSADFVAECERRYATSRAAHQGLVPPTIRLNRWWGYFDPVTTHYLTAAVLEGLR